VTTTLDRSGFGSSITVDTPDEVADILGVSRQYVLKTLVFERRIAYIKIGGHYGSPLRP
jgi:excisionase family DNA binding protein